MKNYFLPADILLPKSSPDKWAVIACDQFTSEPEYWKKAEELREGFPSALDIILPEVYLSGDNAARIEKINSNMKKYLDEGVFKEYKNTFVYTERSVTGGKIRKGVVGLISLDDYSYDRDSHTLIRATEQTVTERIPPRVEIRKDALLEMPHVMLLIDDPEKTVIEPLAGKSSQFETLYDFELMLDGGHIKGMALDSASAAAIQDKLAALTENDEDKLLFAVGDGNHSLAAAKECSKLNQEKSAQYALVEIVNIHDESLEFEPIYRVLFGVSPEKLINAFISSRGGEYNGDDAQHFTCVYGKNEHEISVKPSGKLCVATLQSFLDDYLKQNPSVSIDYIHGEAAVYQLAKKENTVGFIFNGMQKNELFDAVRQDGSLPRKTFSMGHAEDKRYYLEARRLKTEKN